MIWRIWKPSWHLCLSTFPRSLPSNLSTLPGLSEAELQDIINGPDPDDTPPVELHTEGTLNELPEVTDEQVEEVLGGAESDASEEEET